MAGSTAYSLNVAKAKANKSPRNKLRQTRLNQVFCLGSAGKLLYKALVSEVSPKLNELCVISELPVKKIMAMRDGDITGYSLEDCQAAVQNCYWQMLTTSNQYNYTITIKTPAKTYKVSDFWNSDQKEVDALRLEQAKHQEYEPPFTAKY